MHRRKASRLDFPFADTNIASPKACSSHYTIHIKLVFKYADTIVLVSLRAKTHSEMRLFFVVFGCIVAAAAQRPSYAGTGPKGMPSLANRFKDPNETATLENRIGEITSTTGKIPVDALGDGQLVNRLNQWPRENRPFWLLNADHIEASRNTNTNRPVNVQSRSSFVSNQRSNNPTGSFSRERQNYSFERNGGRFDD